MLNLLKQEANYTLTENMAVTHTSSLSDCVDLFATIGALRNASDGEVTKRFMRAFAENPDIAVKTLFFARDIRGGLGERKVFRTILEYMTKHAPDSVIKNIWAVPEFGRYDDLLVLLDSSVKQEVIDHIKTQIEADIKAVDIDESVSLLAKWLPSVNASNKKTIKYGKLIAKAIGKTDAEYRRVLSKLRKRIAIIENNLREKDYSFDYSKQPSRAMLKYRKAFYRNDNERYTGFLNRVEKGEEKLNTGTLFPYDIINPIFNHHYGKNSITLEERKSMDVTWKALEDFTNGENALVVVDGSGSMYGMGNPVPATVALSLGIYFAERNTGKFANHFITFSEKPQLVEIKGNDIYEKVKYSASYNEIANTDIEKVFNLILSAAAKNKLPQSELPATIYVISDMEFDHCAENAGETNFENAKKSFEKHGYKLPTVVFWNVQSRNTQQPVTMNEQGVVLVSGCSPRIFNMVTSGNFSPYTFMLETLGAERYNEIVA